MANLSFNKAEGQSPVRTLIIAGLSIFAAEAMMMFFLIYVFPPFSLQWIELILDSVMLMLIITPLLYLFLFRPLFTNINELQRTEQEIRLLQRLSLEISDAKNTKEALKMVLKEICNDTDWEYGEVWMPQPDKALHEMRSIWFGSAHGLSEFHKKSEEVIFKPGVGLPGRVWKSKRPEWLRNVSEIEEGLFMRAEVAKEFGLKAGLGVPVLAGENVVAVMAFFMFEQRKEDKHLVEIISAVAAQLGTFFLKKQAEDTVKHMAFHDPLTGLPNLRLFRDFSEKAIAFSERNNQRIAVLFIDLDKFKNVNDIFGHDAGDMLLKEIAARLKSCVRKTDIVARIGGDEFVAMLINSKDNKNVSRVAAEIIKTLSVPLTFKKTETKVTPSIGISNYPEDGKEIDILIKKADSAMRTAKKYGGGTYQFHSELEKDTQKSKLQFKTKNY